LFVLIIDIKKTFENARVTDKTYKRKKNEGELRGKWLTEKGRIKTAKKNPQQK